MENLDQTYKRLLSENKKEEKCKGCGKPESKCSCDTVKEELKGGQKNLDKNHNGKLDGQDFAILRNKKKKVVSETTDEPPFDKPYTKSKGTITDKSGAKHTGMSRARDLARSSLNKQLNATYKEYNPEKDKLKKQHFGMAEEVETYDKKSKSHSVAAKLTAGSRTSTAEYHSDGSASIHHKASPGVSSATMADHTLQNAGGDHNNSEADLKNHKQHISGLNFHIKKTASGHTTHISESSLFYRVSQLSEAMKKCKECGKKPCECETMKEEVLDEANHRDYACASCMHPTMAKNMKTGEHMDYYEPKTGDKVHGKVMHKSATEVHMKQTADSYDDKKVGSVHKFKVTDKLPEKVDEVLKPSMGAGAYIDDFIKSKNPQFAGKSSEKRRQMALAAYYAAKKGVKEEAELEEGVYSHDVERAFPNGKASGVKTHAPVAPVPPKKKEQMKPRVGHPTNMKEEVEQLDEKIYADDYHSTSETSQFGGHRPHVIAKDTGKTMYLGQHAYKTPKHAIEHAQAYLSAYSKTGMHGADRASTAYATANKHNHHINEAKDPKEYGYEGDMAMNQLKTLVRCAEMIEDCLKPDTDLPEWVQSKITLATDYIQTAADYLYSEMDESTTETNKYTIAEDNIDEAWMLRQKKKEKKPVKEETVKSFKDFITEMEYDKNGRYVHKGKYGTSYDDPEGKEDSEKSTEKAEKRGRGRPAGAKSGARQIGGASKKGSGVEYTGYKLHLPNSNK